MDLNKWSLVEVPWAVQYTSVVRAWILKSGKLGFLLKLSNLVVYY